MKKCQKDEILQIAFGETNDAARIEQLRETSPEAIREIESLRNIKLNLQQLPVPECQLSTERLRDAILNTGLGEKSVPSMPIWKLVMVPVAVLAVTYFGSQMIRSGAAKEPVVMTASNVTEKGPDVAIDFEPTFRSGEIFGSTLDPIVNEPVTISPVSQSSRRLYNSSRGSSVRTIALAKTEPTAKAALTTMESVAVSTPAALGGSGSSMESMAAAPTSDTGIVLIGSDRDSMTGANKAIEVTDISSMVTAG